MENGLAGATLIVGRQRKEQEEAGWRGLIYTGGRHYEVTVPKVCSWIEEHLGNLIINQPL